MDNGQQSARVLWIFSQFFMIPITAFAYSLEMVLKTVQEMQRATGQGIQALTGLNGSPGQQIEISGGSSATAQSMEHAAAVDAKNGEHNSGNNGTTREEEKALSNDTGYSNGSDRNLGDDLLKLVRYKILFVMRDYEVAFKEKEDLVYDNLDGTAFTAWKIAEFIQDLDKVKHVPEDERSSVGIRIPHRWREKNYPGREYNFHGYLTGLPHDDKKYLRVYYEVLDRYVRDKLRYEEEHLDVLREIRDCICEGGSVDRHGHGHDCDGERDQDGGGHRDFVSSKRGPGD